MKPSPQSIDVGGALRALRALLKNPDDTSQVFRIIDSLSGPAINGLLRRFEDTVEGRQLLRTKPDLLARLLDRDALAALPEGSVGREYLAFLKCEGITTEGLVAASRAGRLESANLTPGHVFIRNRMRDSHDLWHVITGYHGDLVGEASLLAFTLAQTRNPGMALIVAAAWLRGREANVRPLVRQGFQRGLRAEWLPSVPWEDFLPLPLADARRRLGVDAPPAYEPVRTAAYLSAEAA
ncbi:MAG: hypothetical protein FJ104_01495 [Deltaproteobacteria bacterium]|nr:hypothetical protein [Deltaproteobacteria bacterium]